MYRNLALPAAVLVLCCAVSAQADNHVLGQMYGSGVHAYFFAEGSANPFQAQKGYVKAHRHLTAAIDGGTRDPRAYYYRGLAYIELGREVEANVDFKKGAELECGDLNKTYNVGKSLERVQGATRMMLEQYRVKARMAALAEADRVHKVRYEQIRQEEKRVLQEQVDAAPEQPVEIPTPEALAPDSNDPFAVGPQDKQPTAESVEPPQDEPVEPPAEKPAEEPAEVPAEVPAAPAATDDPFDVKPVAEPESTPAVEPAPEPSGEKKPGGVFGAMGRALGKAVGGDGGSETPAPKPEAAPTGDNPFSPETEKPAESDTPTAPAGDDPFGAKPAEPAEPADDNPFGAEPAKPATTGDTPEIDAANPFAQ